MKAYLAEGQKKGSKKWNSSGKHAPPNPTFNQKFQFQVSQDASLENITLNIVVLAKSPEGKFSYIHLCKMSDCVCNIGSTKGPVSVACVQHLLYC